ncbi:MAG: glutathione S-transferase family protein, partial [Paracoccaceae bacterium]
MTHRYVLHYAPDNASLIIRLALEEMGLPYDTVLVDRMQDAQRSAAYRQLNPAGRIPTLETPHGPISETAAILLWLVDRHGRLGPVPTDPARAAFLNWLFFVSNTLHADLLNLFYVRRYGPEPKWPAMREAAKARITRALTVLQDDAAPRLPDWFCAAEPSVLDLYVAAALRWLQLYPVEGAGWFDLPAFPNLHDMCAR